MAQFFSLYAFELKKIVTKKVFPIMLVLGLALLIVFDLADSDWHKQVFPNVTYSASEYVSMCKEKGEQLKGKKVDETFVHDMRKEIVDYAVSNQYLSKKDVKEIKNGTIVIDNFVSKANRGWTLPEFALRDAARAIGYGEVYEEMAAALGDQDQWILTMSDKDIVSAFPGAGAPYHYHGNYRGMLEFSYLIEWFLFVFLATCLAGVFADERTLGTDVLNRSALNGKGKLAWAKLLAGMTVGAGTAAFLFCALYAFNLIVFGTGGADLPFLFWQPEYPVDVTLGQVTLIEFGLSLLQGMVVAAFAMLLSELMNGTQVVGLMAGLFILQVFNLPIHVDWLNRLWEMRPIFVTRFDSMFRPESVLKVGDLSVAPWEQMMVLYVICIPLLCVACSLHYKKAK